MRGVFDEEELKAHGGHDRELTLGSGALLGIIFGLVILCGLCFGLGYVVGHRGVKPATAAAPTAAGDQEPLQANGTVPKPSAVAQTVAAPQAPAAELDASPAASPGTAPAEVAQSPTSAPTGQSPVSQAPASPAPGASSPAQQQVHPAFAPGANAPDSQQAGSQVRPAFAPTVTIMVQIAAVANPDDAEVLVAALRKRNYTVTARHEAADNLIHVRLGPFGSRAEADQWRARLLNDGYNAIVQP